MQIVNPGPEDYHIHSLNFSDGINTVDEIVMFAGKIGMKRIAITDHSDAALKATHMQYAMNRGEVFTRWKNVHNHVEVIFGVEADLLNERGDICATNNGFPADFLILSAHDNIFKGDMKKVTGALIKALRRHKIAIVGHLDLKPYAPYLDVDAVVAEANRLGIALEFNTSLLFKQHMQDQDVLLAMLRKADRVYVNSDAHTLHCLVRNRKEGFRYLKEKGFR